MEDLDSLLEDLGRGKSSTPSSSSSSSSSSTARKPTRPISTRVDLNELEDLMEDLAAPTAKKTPEVTPVASVQSVSVSSASSVSSRPNGNTVQSTPTPTPAPAPASSSSNVDDLESLMESLNVASNNRSSRRQPARASVVNATPATAPTPASASVNVASPAKSNPTYDYTPPTTNTYTPPANTYSPPPQKPANTYTPPTNTYTPPTNTYVPPTNNGPVKGDDLDKLLSNLTSQMDSIEPDNPASRGNCATCRGAILGEMVQALGRCYHPEHFTCGGCKEPLGTRPFYEANGSPHCQNCYQNTFCPKCAHCNNAILDRCITALGKKWHPEHFICGQCLKPFPGGNFFEKDGRPYCENDFFALFATRCGACQEPIKGDCINALGQQWHPEHFVCTYCGKAFSGTFFEHNGKPYCEAHYHQQTGSCCSGCGKPITGRCVNALDKKWHPEHFVCAFCMNPLAGGSFTEKNNKAYCKECHSKLFGS